MLRHTFQHIAGVGPATEAALWARGIRTWQDALMAAPAPWRAASHDSVAAELRESERRLEAGDAEHFQRRLPTCERWRLFPDFRQRLAFLDIETTGLAPWDDAITLIGIYDGVHYRAFVQGFNLEEFPQELRRYSVVVTYNGAAFDARFIEVQFGPVLEGLGHIDLRFPLRRLGYRGGLKAIERLLGFPREDALDGLGGYDAVLLWREHLRGNPSALPTLVRYNAEDVVSLPGLAAIAYNGLTSMLPLGVPPLSPPPRPELALPYDRELVAWLRRRRVLGE